MSFFSKNPHTVYNKIFISYFEYCILVKTVM